MSMRRHPKWVVLASLCVLGACWVLLPPLIFLDLSSGSYHDLGKCPACYGVRFCPEVHSGRVQLQQWSQLSLGGKYLNAHNVLFATHSGRKVVLKKLGSDAELQGLDSEICSRVGERANCDPRVAVQRLAQSLTSDGSSLSATKFATGSDLLLCPSQRKMDYIVEKVFANNKGQNRAVVLDNIITLLLINPEPLLLQAFPQSEGWPFPNYLGACGRMVAEEYAGPTLAEFRGSPWAKRAYLAHQLLMMAKLLTENGSGFSLYVTDVSMDNFAVADDGSVHVIDLENFVVVDQHGLSQGTHYNRNDIYTSSGHDCDKCFRYAVSDLCAHSMSDHNYYAICQGILSSNAISQAMPEGLLHGIPREIMESFPQLSALIEECALPTREEGRFGAVEDLLKTLPKVMNWES